MIPNKIKIFTTRFIDFINTRNPFTLAFDILLLLALITFLSVDFRQIAGDTGEYLNNAYRILYGEIPYRDFWLLFSPGEVYFPALIYKIFGPNINFVRNITIISSLLSSIVIFQIFRQISGKNFYSVIASILFFFVSVIYLYEGPDYINLYLFFILLSIYFLINFVNHNKRLAILLSGLALGSSLMFRFYEGGAALAAVFIIIILEGLLAKQGISKVIKSLLILISGTIIVPVIVTLIFGSNAPKMWYDIVIDSLSNGTSMDVPYFYESIMIVKSIQKDVATLSQSMSISIFAMLCFHLIKLISTTLFYLIPFISIIITVIFLSSKPTRKEILYSMILLLWGFFSIPKGLGRADLAHVAPSAAPMLLLIYYIYTRIKSKQEYKLISKFSIVIISIMFFQVFYPILNIAQIVAKPLSYVETPNGNLVFKAHEEAEEVSRMIDYINKNTNKNDYIFVTPWTAPPLYVLTGRRNPTRYDSMNDPVVRPDSLKELQICNDLQKHRTKLIVHNENWDYDQKSNLRFKNACPKINNFIKSNYIKVRQFAWYDIYILKD